VLSRKIQLKLYPRINHAQLWKTSALAAQKDCKTFVDIF
jgi:hypothetical protein